MSYMKGSWKTTACGCLTLAATAVAQYNFNPLVTKIAGCTAAAFTSIGLLLARDNNVSSEDVGLKPVTATVTTTPEQPKLP